MDVFVVTTPFHEMKDSLFMETACRPKKVLYCLTIKVGSRKRRVPPELVAKVPIVILAGIAFIYPMLKKKARKVTHLKVIFVAEVDETV